MDIKDVSDVGDFVSFMERLRVAAERAGRRKGQIPHDHPLPSMLVMQFMMARSMSLSRPAVSGGQSNFATSQIPPVYLPCLQPANELQPLPISKMRLEEHHRGKRVIIRTMTPTEQMNAIMAIAEDEEGTAVLLQLYNQPDQTVMQADDVLPEGSVCLIKDPFFKVTTDGKYSLRVDHVGDITLLPEGDERIPAQWRNLKTGGSSEEIRQQGNAAVGQRNWGKAEILYSKALASAATLEQKCAALLNRSLANLRLHRPENALDDAAKSQENGNPTEKGLFREAKAHYALEQFSLCCEKLRQVVSLNPDNRDAKRELERTLSRISEQDQGIYQWRQMHNQAKATPPVIDCATYTGPVEVRHSPGRGRGLFTSKAVKAGDLLLCEKAFAYNYAGEDDVISRQNVKILMSLDSKRMTMGGQADLISSLVQKLHHNPHVASRFTDLHRGNYRSGGTTEQSISAVDTFLVATTVGLNCFGAPRASILNWENTGGQKKSYTTCGIWSLASHINHSCVGNCRRSFIGDMMVVRASRDMDADTELLMSYRPPDEGASYKETQKNLQHWDFICRCELCEEKKSVSKQTFQKRQGLLRDLKSTMRTCKTLAQESKAQQLLGQLEGTYVVGKGTHRLELCELHLTLGQKRLARGKPIEALELMIKCLEDGGFIIEANPPGNTSGKPHLKIIRWGHPTERLVTAFLVMSQAYDTEAPELCEAARGFAKTAYAICYGENDTVGEVCGEFK
ncbi:hypothetical protein CORC01_08586 [Colletotrichum orchidophilum]|uniref:SET domain-containing protein n=1 Tax=Colletotrichum orchidophilum TaxID=1209926 RepID=A0A1G4B3Q1_9PEZI|nr:uncharacterized protein CORC01_08586 [Colletotrichum orchidophilum]OHE96049.1 hypothetical protein CORC01_08586 [Colletotrichum orchidophilum]